MSKEIHWIQTGFVMPESQFSFAAVFFECQVEILTRLENEINQVCDDLDRNRISLASDVVQHDIDTLLELINIRAGQLADVLSGEIEHKLGITIKMSLQRLITNLVAIQSRSIKLQIGSLLQPAGREEQISEFRNDIYTVLFSLSEVLKYARQIHAQAEQEWSPVVMDD